MSHLNSTEATTYLIDENSIIENALAIIESKLRKGLVRLGHPKLIGDYFNLQIGALDHEEFHVAFFNPQLELLESRCMFSGTINKCAVFTREIFKAALNLNATRIAISHNHPSGEVTPSAADIRLTKDIKALADLLDIELVDHVIVSHGKFHSMREHDQI